MTPEVTILNHRAEVTEQVIIDAKSIVSGQNYDIIIWIIAQLLTSQPFPDVCQP